MGSIHEAEIVQRGSLYPIWRVGFLMMLRFLERMAVLDLMVPGHRQKMRRSKCKILITLAVKFERTSRYQYGVFQDFDALVTDKIDRDLNHKLKIGKIIEVNRFDTE